MVSDEKHTFTKKQTDRRTVLLTTPATMQLAHSSDLTFVRRVYPSISRPETSEVKP